LGLAIARGLVQAHHGDIAVTNQGQGCRFVVRLPLA
jgi:signal transduction histidine kinase